MDAHEHWLVNRGPFTADYHCDLCAGHSGDRYRCRENCNWDACSECIADPAHRSREKQGSQRRRPKKRSRSGLRLPGSCSVDEFPQLMTAPVLGLSRRITAQPTHIACAPTSAAGASKQDTVPELGRGSGNRWRSRRRSWGPQQGPRARLRGASAGTSAAAGYTVVPHVDHRLWQLAYSIEDAVSTSFATRAVLDLLAGASEGQAAQRRIDDNDDDAESSGSRWSSYDVLRYVQRAPARFVELTRRIVSMHLRVNTHEEMMAAVTNEVTMEGAEDGSNETDSSHAAARPQQVEQLRQVLGRLLVQERQQYMEARLRGDVQLPEPALAQAMIQMATQELESLRGGFGNSGVVGGMLTHSLQAYDTHTC